MFTYLQNRIATEGGNPGPIPRSNEDWDGQFWNTEKLAAAARAQNPGGDGRTVANDASWMGALNNLSGITVRDQARAGYTQYGESSDNEVAATDAVYQDKFGRMYQTVKGADGDPNTYIQFIDKNGAGFQNAEGSGRDRVAPIYKLNPDGTATPHSANTSYREGQWSRDGQEIATWAAIMATAGIGGAYLEGAQLGAEGLSGMDLAADAAAGTGNNTYTAGSQFSGGSGGGGYGGDGYGDTWTGGEGGGDVGGGNVDTSGTNMFEGGQTPQNYSAGDTWTSAGTTGSDNGQWVKGFQNKDIVSGVAQVGSAYMQNQTTNRAINAQTNAANNSNALQLAQYNQTRSDNAPWRAAGENALAKLTGLLNDGSLTSRFAGTNVQNEPGYAFGMREGMKAIDNSASARGGIGGAALKAGTRYAQDYAGTKYNDAFNRNDVETKRIYNSLSNVAGLGQQANALVGASGQNYANQVGRTTNSLGNAESWAAKDQGNIYGNLLNEGVAFGNQNNWWQTRSGG